MSPQKSESTVYTTSEDVLTNDRPDIKQLLEITLDPVSQSSPRSDTIQDGMYPFSLLMVIVSF